MLINVFCRQKESTKVVLTDQDSLNMKIYHANYVLYTVSKWLEPYFSPLNPLNYGWEMMFYYHSGFKECLLQVMNN